MDNNALFILPTRKLFPHRVDVGETPPATTGSPYSSNPTSDLDRRCRRLFKATADEDENDDEHDGEAEGDQRELGAKTSLTVFLEEPLWKKKKDGHKNLGFLEAFCCTDFPAAAEDWYDGGGVSGGVEPPLNDGLGVPG